MHAAIYFFGGAMMASLRAACFKRRVCARCPFGGRFDSFLMILSDMVAISFFLHHPQICSYLLYGNSRCESRTDPIIRIISILFRLTALFLALAVGEATHPIFEPPASRFLISKLGSNLPVRDPFTTFTGQGLFSRSFTSCSFIDD